MLQRGRDEAINPLDLYDSWRLNGAKRITCLVNFFFLTLVLAILPVENRYYKNLRQHFYFFYPQIQRNRPKLLDPLRILIQTVFLLFVRFDPKKGQRSAQAVNALVEFFRKYIGEPVLKKVTRLTVKVDDRANSKKGILLNKKNYVILRVLLVGSLLSCILAVTQPFDVTYQLIFVGLMWLLAVLLKPVKNNVALMLLIFISIIISTRYIYWRITKTVLLTDPVTAVCALLLLAAEIYAYIVLVLSYFQVCWVLDRKPYPLPKDTSLWPTVDIFIPS